MPLLKPTYVVFLVEWPLWEPVQWTAFAHILCKWSPLSPILCPFIYHFLSPLHRLSGCVNNESIFGGGLFDCRWGVEVFGMHGFHSLSIGPCALNNSLTYHFFSWGWKKWWQILQLHQISQLKIEQSFGSIAICWDLHGYLVRSDSVNFLSSDFIFSFSIL